MLKTRNARCGWRPRRGAASSGTPGALSGVPRGHTLIEMLLVVVIISTLAGIAMPKLNYTSMRLDSNVRIVRSTFQQAWRMAIQNQHDILVSIDTVNKRIRVIEDVNQNGLASSGERVTYKPLEDNARFDVPATGVDGTAETASVSGPGIRTVNSMPTFTFRRNGSTSGDVELYLSLSYRGVKTFRGVTVAQATGRTEWFRRVNSTWWRSGGI